MQLKTSFRTKIHKIFFALSILINLYLVGCKNQNYGKENSTTVATQPKKQEIQPFPSLRLFTPNTQNEFLPTFDSVSYSPLESNFDFNFKDYSALKKLKKFHSKYLNFGKYTLYYLKLEEKDLPQEIKNSFVALHCGFIVLYNPLLNHAHFINVENDFYIDSAISMTFTINENGQIHILETSSTEGDYNEQGEMISTHTDTLNLITLMISREGKIEINRKSSN